MHPHRALPLTALALSAVAMACGQTPDPATEEPVIVGVDSDVTYYRDLKPLLEEKCLSCHADGGIAPFTLTDPNDVIAMAGFLSDVTIARTMPPWMPGPDSPPMRGDLSMTTEQIQLFADFAATVAAHPDAPPLGDPADAPTPVPPKTSRSKTPTSSRPWPSPSCRSVSTPARTSCAALCST